MLEFRVYRLLYCAIALVMCGWQEILCDNPTAIVSPYSGPDPGYIIAESDGGLSNRLRVLAAYMHIAESKYDGAHLVFIWDANDACPGHFLQLFQPIRNVIFATNSSRYVLDKRAKIVYENSLAVFTWTMSMNDIPKNKPRWSTIEYNMYSRYSPNREVMNKVAAFVKAHNVCSIAAMHLRTTDLSIHLARKNKAVNIDSYYAFVDSRPADEAVFLLTDSPDSQKLFLDKYGPKKILVYSVIPSADQQKPFILADNSSSSDAIGGIQADSAGSHQTSQGLRGSVLTEVSRSKHLDTSRNAKKLKEDHRYTSLEDALIDVLIAAHSKTFKPAMYSSMSDLVKLFSSIGKKDKGWCA
jgi:hypothetical protein